MKRDIKERVCDSCGKVSQEPWADIRPLPGFDGWVQVIIEGENMWRDYCSPACAIKGLKGVKHENR
jgi:hypothetical protein